MSLHGHALRIREKALALGYEDCGIIPVSDLKDYGERLEERLERFPTMRAVFGRLAIFANPETAVPWARSVVVASRWYGRYRVSPSLTRHIGKYYLVDSRRDEAAREFQDNKRFTEFLKDEGFQVADNRSGAPIPLRWAALKAGIGIIRKNNFFYTERGSWAYLDAWLIDAALELRQESAVHPCPKSCTACQKACPTAALVEPFAMNAARCITFHNTLRGVQAGDQLNEGMNGWVHGCDACQNACPKNKGAWTEEDEFPNLTALEDKLTPEHLFAMDDTELAATISPKLWYISPAEVWKFRTAALNALRNSNPECARVLATQARNDRHEQVRKLAEEILL